MSVSKKQYTRLTNSKQIGYIEDRSIFNNIREKYHFLSMVTSVTSCIHNNGLEQCLYHRFDQLTIVSRLTGYINT